ncbi:unnamed protein product, partial [marine sediment metagenome]
MARKYNNSKAHQNVENPNIEIRSTKQSQNSNVQMTKTF